MWFIVCVCVCAMFVVCAVVVARIMDVCLELQSPIVHAVVVFL